MKAFLKATAFLVLSLFPWNAVLGMAQAPGEETSVPSAFPPTPTVIGEDYAAPPLEFVIGGKKYKREPNEDWVVLKGKDGREWRIPVVDRRGAKGKLRVGTRGWGEWSLFPDSVEPKYWWYIDKNDEEIWRVWIIDEDNLALLWNEKSGIYRLDREKGEVQTIVDYSHVYTPALGTTYRLFSDYTKKYFFTYDGPDAVYFTAEGKILFKSHTSKIIRDGEEYCWDGGFPSSKGDLLIIINQCSEFSNVWWEIWDSNGSLMARLPRGEDPEAYWFPDGERLEYRWVLYEGEWPNQRRIKKRAIFDRWGNWISGDEP